MLSRSTRCRWRMRCATNRSCWVCSRARTACDRVSFLPFLPFFVPPASAPSCGAGSRAISFAGSGSVDFGSGAGFSPRSFHGFPSLPAGPCGPGGPGRPSFPAKCGAGQQRCGDKDQAQAARHAREPRTPVLPAARRTARICPAVRSRPNSESFFYLAHGTWRSRPPGRTRRLVVVSLGVLAGPPGRAEGSRRPLRTSSIHSRF